MFLSGSASVLLSPCSQLWWFLLGWPCPSLAIYLSSCVCPQAPGTLGCAHSRVELRRLPPPHLPRPCPQDWLTTHDLPSSSHQQCLPASSCLAMGSFPAGGTHLSRSPIHVPMGPRSPLLLCPGSQSRPCLSHPPILAGQPDASLLASIAAGSLSGYWRPLP